MYLYRSEKYVSWKTIIFLAFVITVDAKKKHEKDKGLAKSSLH